MNVYENKSKREIKHQFYLQAKKTIPILAESLGFDLSYFLSTHYEIKSKSSLVCPEKRKYVEKLKGATDYSGSQVISSVNYLIDAVREHRSEMKKNSIGTDEYKIKYDLYDKSAKLTMDKVKSWWRDNNARTYVDVKSEKGFINEIIKGGSQYSSTEIRVSPLWYHKVYKHGLHGVQYKGRPCFVISVTPSPIRRLAEDNIDVHKAVILHSHGGEIKMIGDMWLASFKQSEYEIDREGKVIKPSERILSVSPELRRAETNVSQRIGKNVIGSLLS